MAYQTFRQEYLQMPTVTRAYTTACVITTIAVVRAFIIVHNNGSLCQETPKIDI